MRAFKINIFNKSKKMIFCFEKSIDIKAVEESKNSFFILTKILAFVLGFGFIHHQILECISLT